MSDTNSYHGTPKRNNLAWLWATLILAAFIGGILLSQVVFPRGDSAALLQRTAEPTATPTAQPTPQATNTPLHLDGQTAQDSFAQSADFSAVIEAVSPAVVGVSNRVMDGLGYGASLTGETEQGYGSGVIISTEGYIVTNYHVIDGADNVTVILQGGEEVPATVVGGDSLSDLAVLKIDHDNLTAITVGDSGAVKVGQWAIAIGNPLGQRYADTTTFGIISGTNREVTTDGYTRYMLQTDAAINPGNSGGALVNAKGELIGINTLKSQYVNSSGYGATLEMAEGIGLAIPANDVKPIVEEIIAKGYVDRPILGVAGIREIDEYTARANSVPVGILINQVTAGGPAERAGMKGNDIITAVDGADITSYEQLRGIINAHNIGDTLQVTVYRYQERQEYTLNVTLASTGEMLQQQRPDSQQ